MKTIDILPSDHQAATLVGRVFDPALGGPCLVHLRGDRLVDVTSAGPTMADLLELDDPVAALRAVPSTNSYSFEEILGDSLARRTDRPHLLAPCDLQAVKACGVTFARSMIERVIEERAKGDPARALAIREQVDQAVGGALANVQAGSPEAAQVKQVLIESGYWSQYLEVGIGPDAEVFTKAPVLSAVGVGSEVGILRASSWNNPEPEAVLAVNSRGVVRGATLGNDVNLRDIEGRSALLLGKAKDNNASCALGPFIRLFDDGFGIDDVRRLEITLTITGASDNYELRGSSSMREISRDPLDLVSQAIGRHHQYPDGLMLFLGTLFAPTQDRDVAGQGFTHKQGDRVEIATPSLGRLVNTVTFADEAPAWTFGIAALMRNLAQRGLVGPVDHATR
ncbi:fumarylacetoacetate hydrolase family protein [Lichenicola cladoniae]|uniref:Fumarylacetoacetate hydrolase family protein n=1 Tax=Lichenicola cladoniae TaxID=1484109 RepID=A0A6M8HU15_9PROT|nr:fumarylacetoacetate hydrolase family protein [Lichenicola cladoniae]NPD67767.1 fumarylacetoacetate hydrolase family protein [Acetobacteraceae bacterium]QKE91691.1 fumarylacetoacetate hydrolase family protein [Lichenicola cladoniae]